GAAWGGDDDVDLGRGVGRGFHPRLKASLVGHVADERSCRRAARRQRLRRGLQPVSVQVCERDVRATVGEHLRHREPEAARGAGDEGTRAGDVEQPLLHTRAHGTSTARPVTSPLRRLSRTSFTLSSAWVCATSRVSPRPCSWSSSHRSIQLPTRLPTISVSPTTSPTEGTETTPP